MFGQVGSKGVEWDFVMEVKAEDDDGQPTEAEPAKNLAAQETSMIVVTVCLSALCYF